MKEESSLRSREKHYTRDLLGKVDAAKGDTLVVDMSEARVRAGGTGPALIEEYLKRGVTVRSLPSLHAKVFVLGDTAVVGSINVSSWSRDRLTEAGILTTEPAVVDLARQFVIELATRSHRSAICRAVQEAL